VTTRALRRASDAHAASFPHDVVELINYLVPQAAPAHPAPTPGAGYLPEVWLLGSSTYSAQLAGQLGLPFSFAYHFAPAQLDRAVEVYREHFVASQFLERPHLMVAASVVCAADDERARWLSGSSAMNILQRARGRPGPLPSPEEAQSLDLSDAEAAFVAETLATHVIGSPAHVADGLRRLVARTGADEVMVSTRLYDVAARRASLELLAREWGLSPTRARPGEDDAVDRS
jgi:luciferase family oxidoreductase group 1